MCVARDTHKLRILHAILRQLTRAPLQATYMEVAEMSTATSTLLLI